MRRDLETGRDEEAVRDMQAGVGAEVMEGLGLGQGQEGWQTRRRWKIQYIPAHDREHIHTVHTITPSTSSNPYYPLYSTLMLCSY